MSPNARFAEADLSVDGDTGEELFSSHALHLSGWGLVYVLQSTIPRIALAVYAAVSSLSAPLHLATVVSLENLSA